jgi:hypothetical protein
VALPPAIESHAFSMQRVGTESGSDRINSQRACMIHLATSRGNEDDVDRVSTIRVSEWANESLLT